jgi:hypothetical protein
MVMMLGNINMNPISAGGIRRPYLIAERCEVS